LPLLIVELVMKTITLLDLWRRERVKGNRRLWTVIILFVSMFGWISYLLLGREE
jgi:hypothetical protein